MKHMLVDAGVVKTAEFGIRDIRNLHTDILDNVSGIENDIVTLNKIIDSGIKKLKDDGFTSQAAQLKKLADNFEKAVRANAIPVLMRGFRKIIDTIG